MTLLFSIASPVVFRNLFFFPHSVYARMKEIMRERRDLKVVFVLPRGHQRKYPGFVEECRDAGGVVEFVSVPLAKGLPQRIFYFLYSYLIYTGTTRVMATIGTRPDEPPAGGRWYLAPLKHLIAATLGRFRFIKRKVVPWLYLRFFRDRPFADVFARHRPDVVFAPHLYGWFDAVLLAEARRWGIKTIGMAAGWDHLDKYFLPFQTDTLLAQSEQVKQGAIRFQAYPPERIALVGYPHLDFILAREYVMARGETLERLGFPPEAKLIIYVSGSAYCPDEPDIIETILSWADEGRFNADVRLVIRPYSGGRGKDKEFDEEKFRRFAHHPRVAIFRRDFWGDLEKSIYFINILRHADAVVALYTTMVLEAAALDRPLIAPAFDGYHHRPLHRSIRRFEQFEHFGEVLSIGALRTARDFSQLFRFLDAYLKNPELDRDKRELLRRNLYYKLDGKVSERIVERLIYD